MDPVSLVVAALVAGAAAGLKDQAQSVVRDAYQALKELILERHQVDVEPLERRPGSAAKQDSVREDLADAGVEGDGEVLAAAQHVVDTVRQHDAESARAVGIDLDDVVAGFIRISGIDVRGAATGVDLDRVRAGGGIVIENVHVDGGGTAGTP